MMFRLVLLAVGFGASIVILSFSANATAATSQPISAKVLLLSPQIGMGQSVKWLGDVGLWYIDKSNRGRTHRTFHSTSITCSVENKTNGSLTVSRIVKAFVNERGNSAEVSAGSGHWITMHNVPSVVIRGGRAFTTDGKPLQDDPLCMFYSVDWFGVPAGVLRSGTSWSFVTPTWIPSFKRGEHGTATVKSVDLKTGVTVLSISRTLPSERAIVERFDVTIADGGLITSETQRSEGPGMPTIGTFHYETVWRLESRT